MARILLLWRKVGSQKVANPERATPANSIPAFVCESQKNGAPKSAAFSGGGQLEIET
jgi:hypothetical protein